MQRGHKPTNFNPRSSCEARRWMSCNLRTRQEFQSTLLMRGATGVYTHKTLADLNFKPRSYCEERLFTTQGRLLFPVFQSTLLMRGATASFFSSFHAFQISIHAPHARSDSNGQPLSRNTIISIHAPHARSDVGNIRFILMSPNFNPRSSCEERPGESGQYVIQRHFNPRSSCEERPLVVS